MKVADKLFRFVDTLGSRHLQFSRHSEVERRDTLRKRSDVSVVWVRLASHYPEVSDYVKFLSFEQDLGELDRWGVVVALLSVKGFSVERDPYLMLANPNEKLFLSARPAALALEDIALREATSIIKKFHDEIDSNRMDTLFSIARDLRTWRAEKRIAWFDVLFRRLLEESVSEKTMPLMLSALTGSYLIRSEALSRETFRSWLRVKAGEALGHARAESIFSTLQ